MTTVTQCDRCKGIVPPNKAGHWEYTHTVASGARQSLESEGHQQKACMDLCYGCSRDLRIRLKNFEETPDQPDTQS